MKVDDEEALIAKMWDAWRVAHETGVKRRDCMAAVLTVAREYDEQSAQQRIAEARAAAFRDAAAIVREHARRTTEPWPLLGAAEAIEEAAKR